MYTSFMCLLSFIFIYIVSFSIYVLSISIISPATPILLSPRLLFSFLCLRLFFNLALISVSYYHLYLSCIPFVFYIVFLHLCSLLRTSRMSTFIDRPLFPFSNIFLHLYLHLFHLFYFFYYKFRPPFYT